MTEKRFDYTNYDDGTESIYDKEKDEYYFDCEFCKLDEVLNELDEKYVDEYALRETLQLELQRVEEENEQLKHDATVLICSNQEYRKENEQLKQEIKVLRDYGIELLEYINSPSKHRKSIFDAVICFKNKKGDVE